jgi:hypothetical protein
MVKGEISLFTLHSSLFTLLSAWFIGLSFGVRLNFELRALNFFSAILQAQRSCNPA